MAAKLIQQHCTASLRVWVLLSTLFLLCANGQYLAHKEHTKYVQRPGNIAYKKIFASDKTDTSVTSANTGDRENQWTTESSFNPNLDIRLLDIEPEANLFLDEATVGLSAIKSDYDFKSPYHTFKTNQINDGTDIITETRHLALVHPTSSVLVKATYGAFTARRTINPFEVSTNNESWSTGNNVTSRSPPTKMDQSSFPFQELKKSSAAQSRIAAEQITAYLVTKEVRRSHPVLRVLFYASHLAEFRAHSSSTTNEEDKTLCAAVIVQYQGERLFGTCSPTKSRQNACLAEVTIPALYWPPLDVSNGGLYAAKQQKSSSAKVFYTIAHTTQSQLCNDQNFLSLMTSSTTDGDEIVSDLSNTSVNLLYLSEVTLVPFHGSYEEVTNDNVVTILMPQEAVYPNSKIYVPVKYTYNPDYPVSAFSLRVQVKAGLRILGAQLSHPNKLWQLSVQLGAKQTTATVTAFLRDFDQNSAQDSQSLPDELLENMSQEVYSWLIEVEENIDISEVNGRIVWQLLYNTDSVSGMGKQQFDMQQQQSQQQQEDQDFEKESVKLTSLIDIQKDIVQEILAITKSRELLNTAILNGRQVSRPMRIYQVSAAGSISDITFQCSCQSADESIVKVSPSCTSVYLDGSEVRGSQNATIVIKYGSFTGMGNFIVWMPLIPLDVRVSDDKLSQIKGWRVPFLSKRLGPFGEFTDPTKDNRFGFLDQQMMLDEGIAENDKYWASTGSGSSVNNPFLNSCRLRFQQARVEVYTRFLSTDHNSGREASLLNRRHSLRITHLIRNLIRVTDSKVLRIRGNQVEGVSVGQTDVEVISPLTGSVIGSKEVRVTADRESIARLEVRPISGIALQVEPFESNTHNVWSVHAKLTSNLTKQYQEALLDVRVFFSDQTWLSLTEISPSDYDLSVDTFKGVVAYVSRASSGHLGYQSLNSQFSHDMPRLIALLPGQGELVHLRFDSPYACQRKKTTQATTTTTNPLASTYVHINVDFQLANQTTQSLQNDAIIYRRSGNGRGNNNDTAPKSNEPFRVINPLEVSIKKWPNSMSSRRNYPLHQATDTNGANGDEDRITFQRHSTQPSAGNSNFEFGMYSLLMVVSVASIIMAVLYSVFSFRLRTKTSHLTTTVAAVPVDSRRSRNFPPFLSCVNNNPGRTLVANDKEWVWVGKEQFQNGIPRWAQEEDTDDEQVQVHRSLLLPAMCDRNGNVINTVQKALATTNRRDTSHPLHPTTNRTITSQSGVSGECFRITSNPSEMLPDDDKYKSQLSDCGQSRPTGTSPLNCKSYKLSRIEHREQEQPKHKQSNTFAVLIPPNNNKLTRIANPSGPNCTAPPERASSTAAQSIPQRTRHIPLPGKRNLIGGTHHVPHLLPTRAKWSSEQRHGNRSSISDDLSDDESQASLPPVPPHRLAVVDGGGAGSGGGSRDGNGDGDGDGEGEGDGGSNAANMAQPIDNPLPPVPPHRNNRVLENGSTVSAPTTSQSGRVQSNPLRTAQRPGHLHLSTKNTPRCTETNITEYPLDYHSMINVFDRLKESNA